MEDFHGEADRNKDRLKRLVSLAEGYEKRVKEETELTKDQLKTRYVGKVDPKKRMLLIYILNALNMLTLSVDLEDVGQQLIEDNIVSVSRQMIDKEASVPSEKTSLIENGTAVNGANGANGHSMDVDEEL